MAVKEHETWFLDYIQIPSQCLNLIDIIRSQCMSIYVHLR